MSEQQPSPPTNLVSGATFALDAPARTPSVWGADQEVLWAQGEPLMIAGPQGVGKSTLAQRLGLARAEIGTTRDVVGHAVAPDLGRKVLYLALDRPAQIARSLRRMVSERDRRNLEARLIVWRGPLPFDVTVDRDRLLAMAQHAGAGTVVIDSLKDTAAPLTEDRVGAAVNAAIQMVAAAGIEVLTVHHQRKATSDNKRPTTLADVYGSTWVTAGHGSIVLLWGEPGDPVIDFVHLKQPADTVGPLELVHDHAAGAIRARERPTVRALVAASTNGGITVSEVAQQLHGPSPDRNQIERARRKLEDLVRQDIAEKVNGDTSKAPVRYRPTTPAVIERDSQRDRSRPDHAVSRTPVEPHHAPITAHHATSPAPPAPFRGEGRDAEREATQDEQQRYERALALVKDGAA